MASSTTKISCIEDCDGQDNEYEKSGILSAVNLLSKVYMSPKSIEDSHEEVFFTLESDQKNNILSLGAGSCTCVLEA